MSKFQRFAKYVLCGAVAVCVVGLLGVAGLGTEQPQYGGTLRIGVRTEQSTLDATNTSATGVYEIGKHIFERPFTYGANWSPVPLLVEKYDTNEDGTIYYMKLREGVLFHNGQEMTSEDFVASMERWGNFSSRGMTVFELVEEVIATDKYNVEIHLSEPYPVLTAQLAVSRYACNVVPKWVAEKYSAEPIGKEDYIGTGPYTFEKWVPGEYIKLRRFEDYVSPKGPPDGLGGQRIAYFDEIKVIPMPEVGTRLAALEAGEIDFLVAISPDHYSRVERMQLADPSTFMQSGFNLVFLNTKKGPLANQALRQAVLAALDMEPILVTAYMSDEFYDATGNWYPKSSIWYTTAGTVFYDQANVEKAKRLMEEAGYAGEPLRYLTSKEWPSIYDQSIVVKSQLEQVGFNIDLQISDWATVGQKRTNPDLWDMFLTTFNFRFEPSLFPLLSPTYPGWWDTEAKKTCINVLATETDSGKRVEAFESLQALMYVEVPWVLTGKNKYAIGVSTKLCGVDTEWRWRCDDYSFWNAWFAEEGKD